MATETPQPSPHGVPGSTMGVRHYYAAVGNKEAKLTTLMELLQTLQASSRRPLAICCSARDTLDGLVHSLLRSRTFAVTAIHSDMTEKERELALMSFRRGALGGTAAAAAPVGGGLNDGTAGGSLDGDAARAASRMEQEQEVRVLAVTDVCLKALPKELLPLGVTLLVEFDLPPSKEVYTRRVSALFGGGKDRRSQRCVVIDMVEAGAMAAFRALEGFAASPVHEMPVRVGDIFTQ